MLSIYSRFIFVKMHIEISRDKNVLNFIASFQNMYCKVILSVCLLDIYYYRLNMYFQILLKRTEHYIFHSILKWIFYVFKLNGEYTRFSPWLLHMVKVGIRPLIPQREILKVAKMTYFWLNTFITLLIFICIIL